MSFHYFWNIFHWQGGEKNIAYSFVYSVTLYCIWILHWPLGTVNLYAKILLKPTLINFKNLPKPIILNTGGGGGRGEDDI